jgi:hypothetical protein
MLTVLLLVAVVFKVVLCGKPIFSTYLAFAIVSRLTIEIRIESLETSRGGGV